MDFLKKYQNMIALRGLTDHTIKSYSTYMRAYLDYISDKNNIPCVKEYHYLRNKKLKHRIFSRDIYILSKLNANTNAKKESLKNAIPMFLKYNIVETDINDVY